jgi:hypothetical protein
MTNYPTVFNKDDDIDTTQYIIKWSHEVTPCLYSFIRAINQDGSFFGEILLKSDKGGKQLDVIGKMSVSDFALLRSLVHELGVSSTEETFTIPWDGLLAEGPLSHPRIIFQYRRAGKHVSPRNMLFLRIIELLTPYLDKYYNVILSEG